MSVSPPCQICGCPDHVHFVPVRECIEYLRNEVKALEDEHEKVYEILEAVFDADIAALPAEVRDAVLKYRFPMEGF